MITEQERKIAQTLRALSDNDPVDPPTHKTQSSARHFFFSKRVLLLTAGAFLIIASVAMLKPDLPAAFYEMLGAPD